MSDKPASRRTAQKRSTRASILRAASELLRTHGIAATGVAEAMKAVGLTRGGFYAHFASKEALVAEAFRESASETRARFVRGIDERPAGVRLEILLKRYLSAAHRDHPADACPLPSFAGEVATTAPEHAETMAGSVEALAAELALRMPPRGTERSPAPPLSARTMAMGLVALMVGGITLARATRGTRTSEEMLAAARAVGQAAIGSRLG